ncbi:MAG: Chaperone SurA [Acidobacteria bacterium ADurb.Bin051]|nr:MAG: Chaperone SurA [Acidobacteria bacterium ADurb.Bin051]
MPIRSQLGWHLIQVTEIEPAAAESFAQAHDRIRERLFEEEKRARRAEWVRRLREVTPVTIDQRAIERFVASLERSGEAPPAHPVAPVHP